MSEKQAQTRAARRQAMVKERRTAHRQRYDRNKREMLIIKGISITLALIVLGAIDSPASTMFEMSQSQPGARRCQGVLVRQRQPH